MPSAEVLAKMMSPEAVAERRRKAFGDAVIPSQEEIDKLVHPKELARQAKAVDPNEAFFRQIVEPEGLLMDVCLEKAVKIVTDNFLKAGGDSSPEGGGTIMNFVETAGPLALELYRQSLSVIHQIERAKRDAAKKPPGNPA
jgi:hypothetical protein